MGQPAAKQGDMIQGVDTHNLQDAQAAPYQVSLNFQGLIDGDLSSNVKINGKSAAMVGSTAINNPVHEIQAASMSLVFPGKPPENKGTIAMGSDKVRINGKKAARNGDKATTCNDLGMTNNSTVIAIGTVNFG